MKGPIFAKFPLAGAAFALYGVKTGIDQYNGVGQYNDGHSHKLTGAFDIIASISPFLFKEVREPVLKQIEGILGENNIMLNIRAILEMNLTAIGGGTQQPNGAGYEHINPNGYTSNCINCAIAVDRTLAGFPETVPESNTPRSIFDLENIYGGSFRDISTPTEIISQLQKAGLGSRGIVYGERPSSGFDGHVFNVVNDEGNVIFIDGQTDSVVTDLSSFTNLGFLRTN